MFLRPRSGAQESNITSYLQSQGREKEIVVVSPGLCQVLSTEGLAGRDQAFSHSSVYGEAVERANHSYRDVIDVFKCWQSLSHRDC